MGLGGGLHLYRYAAADPLRATDRLGLFCTKDFVSHYLIGKGTPIDLAKVGLLGTYINSPSVAGAIDSVRQSNLTRAVQAAGKLCKNCDSGVKSTTFSWGDSIFANPYDEADCLFSLGSTMLGVSSKCSVTANCGTKTFDFACESAWKLRDKFVDPLSFKETLGLPFEPGTPYDIVADWTDKRVGGGHF